MRIVFLNQMSRMSRLKRQSLSKISFLRIEIESSIEQLINSKIHHKYIFILQQAESNIFIFHNE